MAINDLARVLLGVRRVEHVKISDLLVRTGLPSLNEIVVQQSAVSAWKAAKGGALAGLLHGFDTRTRGASSDLVKAVTPAASHPPTWPESGMLLLTSAKHRL